MSPSTIVAFVTANEGAYRRQSLIQLPEINTALKVSSCQGDEYVADALLGAEIRSILYEYVLFFAIYANFTYCMVTISRTSYFKFVSYSRTNIDKKIGKKKD